MKQGLGEGWGDGLLLWGCLSRQPNPKGLGGFCRKIGDRTARGQVNEDESCIPWCCTVCRQLGTALQDATGREALWVPKVRNLG